jgi:hypothetical protein
MNIFGLVLGEHILLVIFALLFVGLGTYLLRGGWVSKIIGIFLFAGAVGWLASIILYDNARVPGLGLATAPLIALLAACYAAYTVYQQRDVPKRALLGGRSVTVSRNTIVAGALLVTFIIVTIGFLSGADWDSFFRFDDRAANQAYRETTNGVLRFVNRLLRAVDAFLAR